MELGHEQSSKHPHRPIPSPSPSSSPKRKTISNNEQVDQPHEPLLTSTSRDNRASASTARTGRGRGGQQNETEASKRLEEWLYARRKRTARGREHRDCIERGLERGVLERDSLVERGPHSRSPRQRGRWGSLLDDMCVGTCLYTGEDDRHWQLGLLEAFPYDPYLCFSACICPILIYSDNAELSDPGSWWTACVTHAVADAMCALCLCCIWPNLMPFPCSALVRAYARYSTRTALGIRGFIITDLTSATLCYACALIQEQRQLEMEFLESDRLLGIISGEDGGGAIVNDLDAVDVDPDGVDGVDGVDAEHHLDHLHPRHRGEGHQML
ncbi:hypothetical protein AAMO2058_000096600 [Amorphochlora amoebiformis]